MLTFRCHPTLSIAVAAAVARTKPKNCPVKTGIYEPANVPWCDSLNCSKWFFCVWYQKNSGRVLNLRRNLNNLTSLVINDHHNHGVRHCPLVPHIKPCAPRHRLCSMGDDPPSKRIHFLRGWGGVWPSSHSDVTAMHHHQNKSSWDELTSPI